MKGKIKRWLRAKLLTQLYDEQDPFVIPGLILIALCLAAVAWTNIHPNIDEGNHGGLDNRPRRGQRYNGPADSGAREEHGLLLDG